MVSEVSGEVFFITYHGSFSDYEGGKAPVPKDMPGVKDVFLGGCVARGMGRLSETNKRAKAHAHLYGMYDGWVCFQIPEYLNDRSLRMHQLAHIRAKDAKHAKPWREAMAKLGQEIPSRYTQICSK